jgi:gamma-glutamyl-gamma-aminobutyrate hydrolase PuuD
MSKPIIGITSGFNSEGDVFLRRRYCLAIEKAGGVPLILPPSEDTEAVLSICDGILLSGGGDVRPEKYGIYEYDPKLLFEVFEERDDFELKLSRLAYERDLPILAICRGVQVLNVALGGTLLIDIPNHRQTLARHESSHRVNVEPESILCNLTGQVQLNVNSFHHQAIDKTAPVLRVSAISDDRIIEAVEAENKRFVLGVQWHPEHMHDPASKALFKGFVDSIIIMQ